MASKSGGGKSQGSAKSGKSQGGAFSILRDEWVIMRVLLPYLAMLVAMWFGFAGAAIVRVLVWLDYKFVSRTQESLDRNTWIITGLLCISCVVLGSFAWLFWGQRKAVIVKEHATFTVVIAHDWFLLALWEDKGDWMFGRVSIILHIFLCAVIGLTWCFRNWAVSHVEDDNLIGGDGLAHAGLGSATYIE